MSEVWKLENQMQQSMEVTPLSLLCCWAILSWTGFRLCFLPQFSYLFSWTPAWRGTSHECFLYLHYFFPFTSLKDKSKHQNKTLQESFSQNFLLRSRPSHRDVLLLPTGVPISVSPSCRQGCVWVRMSGWHRGQYRGPQGLLQSLWKRA